MLRLILACVIALAFPANTGHAQRDGGQGPSGGMQDAGDRGSIDDRVDEVHNQIDRAAGMSDEDKKRLHQTVDMVRSETDKARQATVLVERLQAEGLIATDAAGKARIESAVRVQLDRIEEGRSTLVEIEQNLRAEIDASPDLTKEQKNEVRGILRDFADKRINENQARQALRRLLGNGGGGGYGGGFVLILVLFVIIESGWFFWGRRLLGCFRPSLRGPASRAGSQGR